jgi:hypothetical protein
VQGIYDFENDPSIEAIDVIMNMHGQPGTLCFWEDGNAKPCTSIAEVANVIKQVPSGNQVGPKKLRALYTDACHGLSQVSYWIDIGFKVAAGSREYDMNHTSDIQRFIKAWIRGKDFERSIDRANSFYAVEASIKLLNRAGILNYPADSTKVTQGDASLTISSPLSAPQN